MPVPAHMNPNTQAPVSIPRQNLPRSQKNDQWGRQTLDGYIGLCSFESVGSSSWRDRVHKNYEYYNGIIDDEDYTHVLKPYGKARDNFPAKLHNYPILKPNIDLLLGEFTKRPRNYSVVVNNPDVVTLKAEAKRKLIGENLQQHFILMLEGLGVVPQGEVMEEPQLPEHIAEEFERTYRDSRAIQGQHALNYIEFACELNMAFRDGWKDFLVGGLVFSRKTAVSGEVVYELLNPLDVDFDKSPDTKFIEDGDWAAYRKLSHLSNVIDTYYDVLTKEEIEQLERPQESDIPLYYRDEPRGLEKGSGRLIEVVTVYWKSIKKVGICSYIDPLTGDEEEYWIEEGEKVDPDHKVEWYYVNEVWEGTRLDGRIYKNIRPYPVQRGSMDNPSKCKLPINGRKYSDRNAPNISLIELGVPFQLTYNIYKYRLENEIAKAKGMLALLDIDMIPEEFGNGDDAIDKWFYYIEAMGVAFQRRAKEGDYVANTFQSVLDLTAKTIKEHLLLLQKIEDEWDNLSGVSRQRKGAISQYDGKGTTEQAIVQSSHITENAFEDYEEFIQREYQGLLDLSKTAFIGGKKAHFIFTDGRQGYLDLDGLNHMEAEYGVFVSGSGRENRKLEGLRQFGQQLATSGNAPLSVLAEIMEAENFIQIKEHIQKVERMAQERQQAQMEAEQALKQEELAQGQRKMEFDAHQRELDRQNKVQIALIQQESQTPEGEGDQGADPNELAQKDREHQDKIQLEHRKLDLQARTSGRQLDLQKEKQDTDATLKKQELKIKDKVASKPKPAAK